MSTYVPIQAITLSATATSVTFSGIPQTYTDLVVVSTLGHSTLDDGVRIRFNNDTGSNYSLTTLYGNGTSALSSRASNQTTGFFSYFVAPVNALSMTIISHIMNYSNTTTNKTVLSRGGRTDTGSNFPGAEAIVTLWRNTSAINTITIFPNSGNIASGSTFTLYGIGSGSPKAFGGDEVRTDGTYWYHIFTSSGRFEPTQSLTCDYLVVAGGGGGPARSGNAGGGGGGGAGGMRCTVTATGGGGSLESALSVSANTSYTVTIGAGGTGGSGGNTVGTSGSNSVFGSITSTGGGFGSLNAGSKAGDGGSGGGEANEASGVDNRGLGTANQGFNGGSGNNSLGNGGAGGGGAGAAGGNATTDTGAAGGAGVATSITGTSVTYAGGGGGGGYNAAGGAGGTGGGGAGSNNASATNGTANTGGGGGGVGSSTTGTRNGGNGGSGIVIIRYLA